MRITATQDSVMTREQLDVLIELAGEAETFFNFENWVTVDHEDDEKGFGRAMRDFLEFDEWGPWEGASDLEDFKRRQRAAGFTNRDVLIALYRDRAFGHSWCSHPSHPDCPYRKEELATRYSDRERELLTTLDDWWSALPIGRAKKVVARG